jgi:hypothetical protein
VGITVHARLVSNDSTVLLSVLQFYHIFTLVESVRDAVYQVLGNGRGSALRANDAPINESASTDECGICMDSAIEIALPCLHSYCKNCYDEWTAEHATCPMCRASTSGIENDIWQFTDAPAAADINAHKTELLAQIAGFSARLPGVRAASSASPPARPVAPPPPLDTTSSSTTTSSPGV